MKRILPVFLLCFLFNSCNLLPEVGIKSHSFGQEVALLQNLYFEFDEELVLDGDLNLWESTPFLNFEPKIEGKFKWIGKKDLVFSPLRPLKFATEYKATLSDHLLKRKKGKLEINHDETIQFHTPFLKINDSQVYFAKNKQNQRETRVLLSLNNKYDGHNISQEIKLFQDKTPINYTTVPAENSDNLVLVLDQTINPDNGEIHAEIAPKMGNASKFKTAIALDIDFQNNEKLEILKTETSFKKLKGYVYIKTSQQVDLTQLEKNIKIEPKVSVTFEQADQGFKIKGEFNQEDLYKIMLSKNVAGVAGGKMDDDFELEAYFGKVDPYLEFTNKKAQYISSLGNKNIGINVVNIPKLNVKISKIYENNILPFINGTRNNYYEEDGEGSYHYSEDNDLYGSVLLDKKIETESLPKKQGVVVLNLPMPEQKNQKGIYFITVRSEEEYYQSIQKIVSMSDIGLIAKMSQNQEDMLVFANSILNTKPIGGLEIKLISKNNQEIIKGKTDQNGIVVFKNLKKLQPNFTVAMISASSTDDYNYLLFSDTQIQTSNYDISGKNMNEAHLEAFIYGDREIYRPGETIHLNTVVRNDSWQTTADLPLKIRVKQPNGKEVNSIMANTNASGALAHSFALDRSAMTGYYLIEVLTGNDILIGSKNIGIEDFMPDRIKVTLTAPDVAKIGDKFALKIQANNLFGPPASDKNYEADFSVKKKRFEPKGFEDYYFGLEDQTKYENELRSGTTNAKGSAGQDFEIGEAYKNKGLLEGKVLVSVFDETGRPVHRIKTFDIYTQKQFFGIKTPGYFVGTNIPMAFDLVALLPDGKPALSTGSCTIVLLDYQTVLEKTENGLRYVSKKKERIIKKINLNYAGKSLSQTFIPKISGEYEIRINESGSESYVASTFYAYGSGTKASFEVDTDGEIQITTNQTTYQLGETAKAIFKTPFDGKLLVTIETNGILEHRFVQTENKSAEIEVKLTDLHLPNVFFTATLFRSMNQPELPLMSAHGMVSIKVDDKKRMIPIVITAADKARSGTKQKIKIQTLPNTELTIAVVDEGILQLKNTETPKIYDYFYQKRALGVSSYDLYPMLLPEIELSTKSSSGGDGSLGKRVNPLANGRAELMAKWSGILKSNADGKIDYEFEIPEFLGSVRIMVVAYQGQNFGSADQTMLVKDPISISVGLPMFLSPNDKVKVPVTFFNTTDVPQEIKISSQVEGQLKRTDFLVNKLTIPAGAEKQSDIEIEALPFIGLAKLKVMASNGTETFAKNTKITVRPAGSLQKSGESGVVNKDTELSLKGPEGYIEGSFQGKIFVSNTPLMNFGSRIQNLLTYPYGCIEQTISKAFPQLYLENLLSSINGDNKSTEIGNSELNPRANVNAAIEKIGAMQLYNGGLSYWPGQTEAYWWGSAYALHFLLEARKNGYNVPKPTIDNLTEYLTNRTNEKEEKEILWFMAKAGNAYPKEQLKSETIYSLYVLSLTDVPNVAAMNEYKTKLNNLTNEQQFMLACAYKQIGDDASFAKILPLTLSRIEFEPMLDGSLSSPVRNMALVLNTLVETDPTNRQIGPMAGALNLVLSNKANYLNTQELSFSLMAFGKLLQKTKTNGKAQILSDGKLIKTIDNKGEWIDYSKYPKGIVIKASNASMYYLWESEGIKKDNKFTPEDKFLKVRRTYFTRSGIQIATPVFAQNQLIVVRLSVSTLGLMHNVNNVVLTDMLPAGFEIENPRLVEDREMPWIINASSPSYFDIRDDRINYFIDVEKKERHFYYLARAITKGTFIQGQASADAMYNGNFRSYSGGGKVVVN